MSKLSIRDLDLKNKRVFIRVDFNVPLAPGGQEITSDKRIKASLPTIQYALANGAAVILASHLGRPKGKPNPEMSLKPVARRLEQLLGGPVKMAPDCIGPQVEAMEPRPGEVLLLENLRFHPEEEKNDPAFSKKLAALCDVYVNDAFGSAHRAHASTVGMIAFVPQAAAGLLPGRVRLVFQPAEEAASGALDVLAAGGIASVGRIFALHCDPRLDAGQLGVRSGPITAACDRIQVRVSGPGGHTARPHLTVDLVYALGKIITEVPAALSRRVDPRSSLSLVWGRVSAGTVANAIPDEGVAEGTVRCLDDEAWHRAPDLLKDLIDSVAASYGVNTELTYQRYVPPTVNDQASAAMLSSAALGVLGAGSVVQTPQSLGGEDFAWYLESIPGALARLGTRVPGSTASLDIHQPTFDVDERAIGVGVRAMAATAINALWDDGAIVAQPLPGVTGA